MNAEAIAPAPTRASGNAAWRHVALCIGFDYVGTGEELDGCCDGARRWAQALTRDACAPVLLVDDADDEPTLAEVRDAICKLGEDAREAFMVDGTRTAIVITYTGHGAHLEDLFDECERGPTTAALLVPSGAASLATVRGSQLRSWLSASWFGPETRVVLVLDCCHSEMAADLAFNVSDDAETPIAREGTAASLSAEIVCLANTCRCGPRRTATTFSAALQESDMRFWNDNATVRSPRALVAAVATRARDLDPAVVRSPHVSASRAMLIDDATYFMPWAP